MDTKTKTEKSPREIAKLFLEKWEIYASPLDAIELLIKARDERAALIAEAHEGHGPWCSSAAGDCQTLTVKAIAATIRGNSNGHQRR
jgi:hypothetical protein